MGECPPVTQHPIGQQPLGWGQREVSHGGSVEEEGQLSAVTHVLVAEGQTGPHTVVRYHMVEDVHPHGAAHFGACPGCLAGGAKEDVVCHNLEGSREVIEFNTIWAKTERSLRSIESGLKQRSIQFVGKQRGH